LQPVAATRDLDYAETLGLLASWAGLIVEVVAAVGTGAPAGLAGHVKVSGRLGPVRMTDGLDGRTYAAHPVGATPAERQPSGLYLHGEDFVSAAETGLGRLELTLAGGLGVRVTVLRDSRVASRLDWVIGGG
jgi:hypothetical protein